MRLFIFVIVSILIYGCAVVPDTRDADRYASKPATQRPYEVEGKVYKPIDSASGYLETGVASWYGADFHGKKTSNGETYNMYAMTSAHKTLPLDTYVRVTRRDTNKSIVVRINDRGPFVSGRIIDLSFTAASYLDIVKDGTAEVTVEALGERKGDTYVARDYSRGDYTLQAGAFRVKYNAVRLQERLKEVSGDVSIQVYDRGDIMLYRVRAGRYATIKDAEAAKANLISRGFESPFVVAEK